MNEDYTSKLCSECNEVLEAIRDQRNKPTHAVRRCLTTSCVRLWHRDINAWRNNFAVFTHENSYEGRRPGKFTRGYQLLDTACLNEQPSNKLRLHTLCHEGKLQGSSRGITHEQSHGYVRVGTTRGGLGIRLRAVVPGLTGELTHMTHSTFPPAFVYPFPGRHNKDILNYLLHTACCSASLTA